MFSAESETRFALSFEDFARGKISFTVVMPRARWKQIKNHQKMMDLHKIQIMKRLKNKNKYLQQHSRSTFRQIFSSSSLSNDRLNAFITRRGVLSAIRMNHWMLGEKNFFGLAKPQNTPKINSLFFRSSADTTTPVECKLTTILKKTFFNSVIFWRIFFFAGTKIKI